MAERPPPPAFTLEGADDGTTLAAALRRRLEGRSWSEVRALCTTGKVTVDGERALDPAARVRAGQTIALRPNAPKPQTVPAGFRIVLEDAHLVVIEKPSGISSVPYDRKETGTALDLIRAAWRRARKRATATPLYTVHRIDKDTSGLIVFAKTRLAERGLHEVFQRHTAARAYLAVAEGEVAAQRIESHLVADRGDGIRGSTRFPDQGQLAITYVEPLRRYPARHKSTVTGGPAAPIAATLCRVRLETGRTHQIRIHLSERGHPLVGETVYVRELLRAGRTPLPAPRLMLHAGLLGFPHPVTGAPIELRAEPPEDFLAVIDSLGGARGDCRL
ncbi:MAG TPA: RluA family pseudouridine synthase [Polyangia bacterium]|nr:RluA family pseudouridine synthase [Polyangia bacterium]